MQCRVGNAGEHAQSTLAIYSPRSVLQGQPTRSIQGTTLDGDPDLLMHYLVCRVAGLPVLGTEPHAVFGTVPRSIVLAHLATELLWGLSTRQRRMRS